MINPDTENVAAEIKKLFYDFKREQLGRPYSPADRMRKPQFWTAAAENCIFLQASPCEFVRAAFKFNNVPGGPFPNQLGGTAAQGWYRKLCRMLGADGLTGIEVTMQEVKDIMARTMTLVVQQRRRPVTYLLDDYGVRLDIIPAYARVMLYPDNQAILAKWKKKAVEELNSQPDLLEAVRRLGYRLEVLDD